MRIFILVLILFTAIGCYLDLDNPKFLGIPDIDIVYILFHLDLIDFDATFVYTQWEYGIISIICFIYAALKEKNQKWILITELLITLIRYFFTKDGYSVGFLGGALENIVFYFYAHLVALNCIQLSFEVIIFSNSNCYCNRNNYCKNQTVIF